jgi:acyl-CoA dehydrogenase
MDSLLLDSLVRLLDEISSPAAVRRAEQNGDVADMQRAINESGFLGALVREAQGGSGLALADVAPLFVGAGRYLLPVPFAETMVARAVISRVGREFPPDAAIMLWPATPDGRLRSQIAPLGARSSLALVQRGETFELLPTNVRARAADPFQMTTAVPDFKARSLLNFTLSQVDLLNWAAAITAANMAGAMDQMLAMSLTHVNDRRQFGRSLGKFQAIQQQLSVFAEKTAAAQVAAHIGLSETHLALDGWRVAVAKSTVNEAAGACAAIAHAVHGAIGISQEHDLQLYTRRLKRWQISFGSEAYWARQVGRRRLEADAGNSVDFLRARLAPASFVS